MRYRMMMLALLAGCAGVTGCHPFRAMKQAGMSCHDVNPYLVAGSIPQLKIPTGLDAPDTSNALHIPPLSEPAPPPRKKTDPCLDEPPAFKTKPASPEA